MTIASACAALLLLVCHVSCETKYVNPPKHADCRFTKDGTAYRGTKSVALSGNTCQMWSLREEYTKDNFAGDSVAEMSNYCRNPTTNGTAEEPTPWCYTVVGKEYCDITMCSELTFKSTKQCFLDNGFMSYAGHMTHTNSCLLWTDDAVQAQGFQLWQFPGSHSWDEMENFCRNPDNDVGPWCYSQPVYEQENKLEKVYCTNFTACSKICRLTEASIEYVGKRDRSQTRKPCVPAQLMIPKIFVGDEERRRWFEHKYVNDDYYISLTQCRSYPDQLTEGGFNTIGPSCYVNNSGEIVEEGCAIHYCRGGFNFTTAFVEPETEGTQASTTTSAEVGAAWDVIVNWTDHSIEAPPKQLPVSTTIGIVLWTATGLFLLALMLLDCSSLEKCKSRCKRNSKDISGKMKDLYGSRVSLRSNQISPDSTSGREEKKKQAAWEAKKTSVV